MPQKKQNKKRILGRYGGVVAIIIILASTIIFSATKFIFSQEAKRWAEVGEKSSIITDRIIVPKRGNIYASDGRILAISNPLFSIYMDFWAEGIKEDTLKKYVGDLSVALAKKFPDRNASQYKNLIEKSWRKRKEEERLIKQYEAEGKDIKISKRTRYVRLIKRDISYVELKEIRTFPFLNQRTNRSGLICEEKNSRKKPFGNLANRTIGNVYKDLERGGASGLELKFDSLLCGIPGVKVRKKIQGRWTDIEQIPAQDGANLITSINPEIQEITERALRDKLVETDAASGTAIIMEVETGEIKGIANLNKTSSGGYAEGTPNAFSYMNEPGSTFKTVTVMVALDDGVITPTDSFHVGRGLLQYNKRWVRDHWWRRGQDRGYFTVKKGIEISSNVVMSKIVLKGYSKDPKKYIDGIDRIGLRKQLTWDVPLSGIEGTSSIRYPNDKKNPWSKTTLPWMSFGYECKVPPIYLLMFYNGIANNGKMIKPQIAKRIEQDGKVIREFEPEVINAKMCKDETLAQIKDMLIGVVEEGTGQAVKSDFFSIAGKTGTAQIAGKGGYQNGYYVSFCGYFPANNPKYTCFVGIRQPKAAPSGGLITGVVFKNIAEQTFAIDRSLGVEHITTDTTVAKMPNLKNGNSQYIKKLISSLDYNLETSTENSRWIQASYDSTAYIGRELSIKQGMVPNVMGMGARDALYLLEESGLKVSLSGFGEVVSQSIEPGNKVQKGTKISIVLK